MSSLKRQLLLRAYLLATNTPPAPIDFNKQTHTFSRWYLAHLSTGGRPNEPLDLVLVDLFLDGWDNRLTRGQS